MVHCLHGDSNGRKLQIVKIIQEECHAGKLSDTYSERGSCASSPAGALLFSAGKDDPADAAHPDKYGSVDLFVPGPDSQPVYTFYGNPLIGHLETAQENSS